MRSDGWGLREIPPVLMNRYVDAGWWRDDTVGQMLADAIGERPELTVKIRSSVRPWTGTFADVLGAARRMASALQERGIGAGDVVAFQLPNWIEAAVSFWAAALLGAVVTPIVHFYGPKEVAYILRRTAVRALITADGFNAVRSLLHARTGYARRRRPYSRPGSRGRRGSWRQGVEGRWTLLPPPEPVDDAQELAEAVATQLLLRWGVVFRDVYLKERLAVPWREVLWALRRLEARGLIRGGHFVTGITGEQFADESAMPLLRGRQAA